MRNKIAIDSLKVRIPMLQAEVLDAGIFGKRYVIEAESGNIEREFDANKTSHKENGITVSFGIEKQVTDEQKVREFLVILFNSKALKENYFDGITSDNLKKVYEYIISLNLVSFSYDAFLQAEATDVDYKLDKVNHEFHRSMKSMRTHAKSSVQINRGINYFDSKKNRGIEFGKRHTATVSYPFLKFYNKELELLNASDTFYSKYIKNAHDITDLIRCEFTIKNKKHYKRYGIEDTTLQSILSLSQEDLHAILRQVLSVHLERRIAPIKTINEMTPNDRILYNAMYVLMEQNGMNYNLIRETLIQGFERKERFRKREKMDYIYETFIKGTQADTTAEAMNEWFEAIGWE